jgi:serine/threonine-protein kinase
MAPEVIEDHKKASKPADIWALGALLHFFITGEPPYGVGLAAVPKILIASPPSPPSFFANAKQFRPLTEELWAIVTQCLSKAPNGRPTANELIELCSVLCYSSAPRKSGVIEGFRYNSGSWGTITGDDGQSVFFHADSGYTKVRLQKGQRVDFACFPGLPRPRAFPVLPMSSIIRRGPLRSSNLAHLRC